MDPVEAREDDQRSRYIRKSILPFFFPFLEIYKQSSRSFIFDKTNLSRCSSLPRFEDNELDMK